MPAFCLSGILGYFVHIVHARCRVILATEIEKVHTFAAKGGRDDATHTYYQKILGTKKTVFV